MPQITLYKTNSDLVCARKDDGPVWEFGAVTADMYGKFAEDAAAWCDGDWEPCEGDGQHIAASDDGLEPVALWDNVGRQVVPLMDADHMGGAAQLYVLGKTEQ